MAMESLALILFVSAAAVLALLLGRLLSALLKIAILAALMYFALTRIDFKSWEMCRDAAPSRNAVSAWLCR